MTTSEFSNEFDILYNNSNNIAPGFNEYEKSVFLTKAQEEIVIELYSGKNLFRESFESTEEIRTYLMPLIKTLELPVTDSNRVIIRDSLIFILNEEVRVFKTGDNPFYIKVIPTTLDKVHNVENNPFKSKNDFVVYRVEEDTNTFRLISDYKLNDYYVTYLSKPTPIILEDLSSYNVSIDGVTMVTECVLHPIIHRIILKRAVEIALNNINNIKSL